MAVLMSLYSDLIAELKRRGLEVVDWDYNDSGEGWILVKCTSDNFWECREKVFEAKQALAWYGDDLGKVVVLFD